MIEVEFGRCENPDMKWVINEVMGNGNDDFKEETFRIKIDNKLPIVYSYTRSEEEYKKSEELRLIALKYWKSSQEFNAEKIVLAGSFADVKAVMEGLLFSDYSFQKHKSKKKAGPSVVLFLPEVYKEEISETLRLFKWVNKSRDWINEPYGQLSATELAREIGETGEKLNIKTTIFGKKEIQELKMGGLMAVNKGSSQPPSFTIMEHKPSNAINTSPIVLVGKGVVFDTGGYTLKDTPNSMDVMKCDMAGAAIVANCLFAVAESELPIWCIALIPATDNMIGPDSLVPSEIITLMNNTTVEVMNTDAEGRLILADALLYAKQFAPELVVDAATLTGAAISTLGHEGSVMCSTASENTKSLLTKASHLTYERFVELPLWEEYEEELKSTVADLKNIGSGSFAGSIVAATFLKQFVDYPWIHLDVAGPVYSKTKRKYYPEGATGYGVRLLYHFLKLRVKASDLERTVS